MKDSGEEVEVLRRHEAWRTALEERASRPPLENVQSFLQAMIADSGDLDEVAARLRRPARTHPWTVTRDADALDALIADFELEPGTLARLVAVDANRSLDEYTDEAAREWLREIAVVVRAAATG